jgi:hypothetical protein
MMTAKKLKINKIFNIFLFYKKSKRKVSNFFSSTEFVINSGNEKQYIANASKTKKRNQEKRHLLLKLNAFSKD